MLIMQLYFMKSVNISFRSIYLSIFKREAPAFLDEARTFIATMGDWYVVESFSYIRIQGSNTIHMLPKIVPDRLYIEEVSFQNVTDGVYKKLFGPKKKGWPKFPLDLRPLVVPTSTWAAVLGDQVLISSKTISRLIMFMRKSLMILFIREWIFFSWILG